MEGRKQAGKKILMNYKSVAEQWRGKSMHKLNYTAWSDLVLINVSDWVL